MIVLALAMVVAAVVIPVDAARPGLIGGALGVGLAGLLLAYLDAPSRKRKPAPGMARAKATILDAAGTPGAVAGYQMVELTLRCGPRTASPSRSSASSPPAASAAIEQGRTLDVAYDPANPEKLELA